MSLASDSSNSRILANPPLGQPTGPAPLLARGEGEKMYAPHSKSSIEISSVFDQYRESNKHPSVSIWKKEGKKLRSVSESSGR